jgi:transcription antitermination factor NusG
MRLLQQPASKKIGPQHRAPIGSRRWYVAVTEPGKEGLAVRNLEQQSFRSMCPRFRKTRRHARRTHEVLAPLFPGYVFVSFDVDNDPWRSINGTLGVRRLISFDPARPQPMPEAAMTQLMGRCDDGLVTRLIGGVRAGDAVKVISGPFAGQLAAVESLDAKGRVRILLDILGGATGLQIRIGCLAPATV